MCKELVSKSCDKVHLYRSDASRSDASLPTDQSVLSR